MLEHPHQRKAVVQSDWAISALEPLAREETTHTATDGNLLTVTNTLHYLRS